MAVMTTVHEEEAAARRKLRNLEKARRVKAAKAERRRKEAERAERRATAKERAAEARRLREEEHYANTLAEHGALTVPTADEQVALERAERWQRRGIAVEVVNVPDFGWIVREVVA